MPALPLFTLFSLLLPVSLLAQGRGSTPALPLALPDASDGRFRTRYLAWDALAPLDPVSSSVSMLRPVDATKLSSAFGPRTSPIAGASRWHEGVDIPSPAGTPVRAVADGVIVRAGWAGGYGNLVEIDHGGGMVTRYGHLSTIFAGPLATVRRGETIGAVGSTGISTGSHLHYEVRLNGRAVDPGPWLSGVVTLTRTTSVYDDRPTISSFARARGEAAGRGLTPPQ